MSVSNRLKVMSISLGAFFVCTDGQAQAPAPGSPGPPPTRQERPDDRTRSAREAETYDARGVRLGSFMLFPAIELDEAFNDNVFAVSAANGPVASFLQTVRPTIELRSLWSNHMLNFYARGDIGFYTSASAQNYQDVAVGAEGRLDIQRNWNAYGSVSFNRKHEDPGLPNTVSGPAGVTIYNQWSGRAGYYQKINRLSGRVEFAVDRLTFFDNGLGVAQGVVPNSDRDRTELRESLRIGYEFINGYEFWVRGGFNQRLYVSPVDVTGFARNSNGFDAVAGITIDFGGLTTIEAFAGYLQQNYVNVGTPPLQGPQFGLTAYWNPLRDLWVRPYVRRTVNEAAYVGDSGYLNTSMGASATYNLFPNVRLNGGADYSIADYRSFSSTNPRYDQYITASVSVTYLPVNQFYLEPSYRFVHRTSNLTGLDYSQNLIMLRLGMRL